MTEAEWRDCNELEAMLASLGARASQRKLRLFACACCRRLWQWYETGNPDYRIEPALAKALVAIEGLAEEGRTDVGEPPPDWSRPSGYGVSEWNGAWAAWRGDALEAARQVSSWVWCSSDLSEFQTRGGGVEQGMEELAAQSTLASDIFNPFARRPRRRPVWRTETVVSLARAAYEKRFLPRGHLDPQRLAVLADALLDAGCEADDLLTHLRSPGPHVRGCWVIDLLLRTT